MRNIKITINKKIITLNKEKRKILLKDLTPSRGIGGEGIDFYAEISKYVDTAHEIVIWETNVSQKKTYNQSNSAFSHYLT